MGQLRPVLVGVILDAPGDPELDEGGTQRHKYDGREQKDGVAPGVPVVATPEPSATEHHRPYRDVPYVRDDAGNSGSDARQQYVPVHDVPYLMPYDRLELARVQRCEYG